MTYVFIYDIDIYIYIYMQLYTYIYMYINIHIMQLLPYQGELGEILAQLSTGIRSLDGTLHSVKRRREKAFRKPAG